MHDPRAARLLTAALAGRIGRRQALSLGLRLGLASPVISALMAATPERGATAPAPLAAPRRLPRGQESSGTFTVILQAAIPDLDPHYSYDNYASMFFIGPYEMLIQLKGETTDQFEPMLAQSWEGNEDGSVYTFKLPEGALFHDGTPCDAAAVKASYTRFLEQGAGPVNVLSRFVKDPNQMEAVDATTIRFNLGRPQPLFLPAMASEYGPFVISPTAIEENKTEEDPFAHEWLQGNAVGSGPYELDEYLPNEQVVMSRFSDYHQGWEGNHFDRVVLRIVPENSTRRQLIEQGDADAITLSLTPEDVEAMKGHPDLQVLTYDTTQVQWNIMNVPRLKTVEVRRGFSYAFPYDEVVNGVYKGLLTRTSGPIPAGILGYDPNGFIYQTDLAKAKELILAGGFKEGDSFEYLVEAEDELDKAVAQLFQANVQQIGFDLQLSEVDGATHSQTVYGDAPAEERPHFFGGWSWWPDYNDAWNQLAPNFLKASTGGGGSNAGFWVNERFEEIMAEAETYTDEARLVELMKEAQKILTEEDPPVIYQGQAKWYTILRKDIQGFYPNPLYLSAYPFYKMSRAGGG